MTAPNAAITELERQVEAGQIQSRNQMVDYLVRNGFDEFNAQEIIAVVMDDFAGDLAVVDNGTRQSELTGEPIEQGES